MNRETTPYPWDALPRVTRSNAAAVRRVRRGVAGALRPVQLSSSLASVLASDVRIVVRDTSPSSASAPPPERSVHLAAADGTVAFSIDPEPALVSALLARILERPFRLTPGEAPLEAPLRGALAALGVEVARRTGGSIELVARDEPARGDGLRVEATVFVDDRPYGVSAWAFSGSASSTADRSVTLADLGELPITVPQVVAESAARRDEIFGAAAGDVWMPGDGWFEGGVLAAPSSERGVGIRHSEDGRIVVLETVVALAAGDPAPRHPSDVSNMGGPEQDLNEAVLASPVVVRVEVGAVTLTAREWAAVRPGDVLETGAELAEPVVLRIAGKEVARGQLVNLDGELGVKILELVTPGRSP